MTRLTLILIVWWLLMAPVALVAWALRRQREKRERERTYQFWSEQCNESLRRMREATSEEEYRRWSDAALVNIRRYEREVLEKP